MVNARDLKRECFHRKIQAHGNAVSNCCCCDIGSLTGWPIFIQVCAVQVTILMSLLDYEGFVDKCDTASREFATLDNGVIVRRPKDDHFERLLAIRCDIVDADRLLYLATAVYPEAVDDIAKAIAAARRSH